MADPNALTRNKCNEATIRNPASALEDITEPAAKTTAAQQNFLDFLAEDVLDNRVTLYYLLAEQGVCAMANTTC